MPTRAATVVTTEARQHVQWNPKRASLILRNVSANPIFICEDRVSVTTNGFDLNENEVIAFSRRDGDEPEIALYFQSTGGNATLKIVERFGPVDASP